MTRHAFPPGTGPTLTPFDFEAASLDLFRRLRSARGAVAGGEPAPHPESRAALTARLARIGEAGNDAACVAMRVRRLAA